MIKIREKDISYILNLSVIGRKASIDYDIPYLCKINGQFLSGKFEDETNHNYGYDDEFPLDEGVYFRGANWNSYHPLAKGYGWEGLWEIIE